MPNVEAQFFALINSLKNDLVEETSDPDMQPCEYDVARMILMLWDLRAQDTLSGHIYFDPVALDELDQLFQDLRSEIGTESFYGDRHELRDRLEDISAGIANRKRQAQLRLRERAKGKIGLSRAINKLAKNPNQPLTYDDFIDECQAPHSSRRMPPPPQ